MPEAEAIYERARDAWSHQAPPPCLKYTIVVRVDDSGTKREEHYSAEYVHRDGATDAVDVHGFSEEEAARPFVAHGINVTIALQGVNVVQLSRDQAPTDYLGIPVLDPLYSFGVRRTQAVTSPSTAPIPSTLKPIGSVAARQRDYGIVLVDEEPVDGHQTYHLRLRPLRDPHRYRLRDLWIDTTTFETVRLVTDGNFTDGPSVGVPWTVSFRDVGGVSYIASETANARLRFDRFRRYDDATITFNDVRTERPPMFVLTHPRRDEELREPVQP